MTLTKLEKDLDIISKLDNEPNDVGGLTAEQLKARFDEAGNAVKAYINETLTTELENGFATKEEVQGLVLGQLPDGTITEEKLAAMLNAKIDSAIQPKDMIDSNVLASPNVAAALGLMGKPQVVDALLKLAYGAYAFQVKITAKGTPLKDVNIEGLRAVGGGPCKTNDLGETIGLSDTANPTVSIKNYVDLAPYASTLTSTSGLTSIVIELDEKENKHAAILSTDSVLFSRPVSLKLHLVGGGTKGNTGGANTGGVGGTSGRSFHISGIAAAANTPYLCEIGGPEGNTAFLGKSSTSGTQNLGGAGGTGNNAGSPGTGGGTSPIHSSYRFGGSGGGGGGYSEYGMTGGVGSNGGGQGGKGESLTGWGGPATEGSNANTAWPGAGGGGGGGRSSGQSSLPGGVGVGGAAYFSWEYN